MVYSVALRTNFAVLNVAKRNPAVHSQLGYFVLTAQRVGSRWSKLLMLQTLDHYG